MLDNSPKLRDIINRLAKIYGQLDECGLTEEAEELSCIIEELKQDL